MGRYRQRVKWNEPITRSSIDWLDLEQRYQAIAGRWGKILRFALGVMTGLFLAILLIQRQLLPTGLLWSWMLVITIITIIIASFRKLAVKRAKVASRNYSGMWKAEIDKVRREPTYRPPRKKPND